jgi:hypothetical protein
MSDIALMGKFFRYQNELGAAIDRLLLAGRELRTVLRNLR